MNIFQPEKLGFQSWNPRATRERRSYSPHHTETHHTSQVQVPKLRAIMAVLTIMLAARHYQRRFLKNSPNRMQSIRQSRLIFNRYLQVDFSIFPPALNWPHPNFQVGKLGLEQLFQLEKYQLAGLIQRLENNFPRGIILKGVCFRLESEFFFHFFGFQSSRLESMDGFEHFQFNLKTLEFVEHAATRFISSGPQPTLSTDSHTRARQHASQVQVPKLRGILAVLTTLHAVIASFSEISQTA